MYHTAGGLSHYVPGIVFSFLPFFLPFVVDIVWLAGFCIFFLPACSLRFIAVHCMAKSFALFAMCISECVAVRDRRAVALVIVGVGTGTGCVGCRWVAKPVSCEKHTPHAYMLVRQSTRRMQLEECVLELFWSSSLPSFAQRTLADDRQTTDRRKGSVDCRPH